MDSKPHEVALLAEGVDRNIVPLEQVIYCRVALLAEGVDRNRIERQKTHSGHVALLAEGVDRNHHVDIDAKQLIESPSSRRAWIEIMLMASCWEGFIRRPPRGGRG